MAGLPAAPFINLLSSGSAESRQLSPQKFRSSRLAPAARSRRPSPPSYANRNMLAIALANKLARIAWAVLARGRSYQPRIVADVA
jgi:hypothetical protein